MIYNMSLSKYEIYQQKLQEKINDEIYLEHQPEYSKYMKQIIIKDGNTYEGIFINGKLNGIGKIIFKSGQIQEGIFLHLQIQIKN